MAFNLNDTKHEIAIAKQQASISDSKSQLKKNEGNEYASRVYRIRAKALRCFIKEQQNNINKHSQKAYKKANK